MKKDQRNKDWDHTEYSENEYANSQGPGKQKGGRILYEREMIDPEKREVLKAMGFGQVFLHDTPVFGPSFKDIVDQSDLIPSDVFVSLPDQKWEVIYMGYDRDRMIIRERAKGPDGVIDCGMPYNWETGIKRLKQLLDGKQTEDTGDRPSQ